MRRGYLVMAEEVVKGEEVEEDGSTTMEKKMMTKKKNLETQR